MALKTVRKLRSLLRSTSGAVLVEFALISPVLVVMLLGMIDAGMWATARLSVYRAARAGAEYAVKNGYDSASVTTAVTGAAPSRSGFLSTIAANPAPSMWYGCSNTTTTITASVQNGACTNGTTAGTYVTSNAQATYTYIVPWPMIGNGTSTVISSSVTVRIS